MGERTGVFVCECGPNIGDAMNVAELVSRASGLPGVVHAERHRLLCSDEGKRVIEDAVRKHGLTRVVVAACSPKEHEKTFRGVLECSGLNPFLLQMANIREQCAWVTRDTALATEKAGRLIRAAVNRVARHAPLEAREIDCMPDALVVGAGVAGMSAALTMAQKARKVYVVEKEPWVGGSTVRCEDVFPGLECASCMLEPMMDELLHNDRIEVLTGTEVAEVLGSRGNYTVRVTTHARSVDIGSCIGCGTCAQACPVRVPDPQVAGQGERAAIDTPFAGALPSVPALDRNACPRYADGEAGEGEPCGACAAACPFGAIDYSQEDVSRELTVGAVVLATGFTLFDSETAGRYGWGTIPDVRDALEFERMLSSNGPTDGRVVKASGDEPDTVALIHCVGSRTSEFHSYCSGVCCGYMLKFAHLIRKQLPDARVLDLCADLCLPGRGAERLHRELLADGKVEFLRTMEPGSVKVEERDGRPVVTYVSAQGEILSRECDVVVLAPAMEGGSDAARLAELFEIAPPDDASGFLESVHAKLAPVSTTSEGVFVVGAARGPCDIETAVAQGQAAAGKVLQSLVPGERLVLEATVATVDGDACSRCGVCVSVCPFGAMKRGREDGLIRADDTLCRGCGTCAAACPSGAASAMHFDDAQISAEIRGALR
ncbi:MAG: CoB--CoM heterodisulfide reductase iron-sulfur subunit A family protein [Candidatus Eisenbacteria bacterium]